MSKATPYEPKPGSIPARAIALLHEQPAGAIFSGRDLAEAIGVRQSDIPSALEFALKHSLLRRKMYPPPPGKKSGVYGYSLPLGDAFDQDDANGGRPLQRVVPAAQITKPAGAVPSVFALAAHMAPGALPFDLVGDEPAPPQAEPAGLNWKPGKPLKAVLQDDQQPAPANTVAQQIHVDAGVSREEIAAVFGGATRAPSPPLECALWSNGELWLRIDGAPSIVLDRAKTEHLIHYLDRMALELSPATTT